MIPPETRTILLRDLNVDPCRAVVQSGATPSGAHPDRAPTWGPSVVTVPGRRPLGTLVRRRARDDLLTVAPQHDPSHVVGPRRRRHRRRGTGRPGAAACPTVW
ncbi:hypothetical protein ACFPM0_10650 [Pseudonocardia sulfidoxydans]|uniref:hypothetical protein n=1 Tax=Pseudonocardia sulfidoxydans TaxID=54011 RepID=UPI00360A06ED